MPNPHNSQQSVRSVQQFWIEFLQVSGCPATEARPAEEELPSQDAPCGENVVSQEEAQAVADAAPTVVEPQQEGVDNG